MLPKYFTATNLRDNVKSVRCIVGSDLNATASTIFIPVENELAIFKRSSQKHKFNIIYIAAMHLSQAATTHAAIECNKYLITVNTEKLL